MEVGYLLIILTLQQELYFHAIVHLILELHDSH